MPRKSKQTPETTPTAAPAPTPAEANGTETVAGYFRRIFAENPRLLKQRSNEELYARWLADHPGHSEVPQTVRTGLQNIKSVLRHEKKKPGPKPAQATEGTTASAAPVTQSRPKAVGQALDRLETMIDQCLFEARGLDAAGLAKVVDLLRQARNGVIRKGGPPE